MNKPKTPVFHLVENTVSLFSVKGIDLVLAVLLIPYLISVVDLENYGRYVFALVFVLFFVNIANYGFDLSAVRALAAHKKTRKHINNQFNVVFSVKVYLTVFLLLLYAVMAFVLPKIAQNLWLYVFASGMLISELFALRWFFMGVEKMKFIPVIHLLATLLFVVLVLLFVREPKDFIYIILFEAIGVFLANALSFMYIVQEYKLSIKLSSFKQVSDYIINHFFNFVTLLVPSMLSNIAVFIVGVFSIPVHVSIMQLGVKYANAFTTVNAILTKVLYPMVNRVRHSRQWTNALLLGAGVVFSLIMYVSAPWLIQPWLQLKDTAVTAQIVNVIHWLSPVPFFMAVLSAYGINGLLVWGKDHILAYSIVAATLIGVLVGFAVAPRYAYMGGAVFLLTARGLYALLAVVFFVTEKRNHQLK
jgi:O-antigen/teichoic acid export membrane protein